MCISHIREGRQAKAHPFQTFGATPNKITKKNSQNQRRFQMQKQPKATMAWIHPSLLLPEHLLDHGSWKASWDPRIPYKFRSFPLPPSSGLQLRKCEGRNRPNFRSFSSLSSLSSSIPEMEMRKIACVVLVATAAVATTALAAEAPAPGPAASASFAVTPAAGAAIGASLFSFFAFFLQ
ncbi:hypothetical protein ZIOFF_048475 [Zingiber officinale]|uniref:Uncharacterized protein n=1 Tax=Zingiber officinale TaxID=94328 RepID=A0A8J5KWP9_ZINOF|nr:hypothetical protein ZIOFF_048475 [Zingiber officinale]